MVANTANDADTTTATDDDETTTTTTVVYADDSAARSQFGSKTYWDDLYDGRGDFPADEYSWYFGFEVLEPILKSFCCNDDNGKKVARHRKSILIPGIGNDPILYDIMRSDLAQTFAQITAQDYSHHALDRQRDLLEYSHINIHDGHDDPNDDERGIQLCQGDVRQLPASWTGRFDVILEKGLLDAVYLSGDGYVELAAEEFRRILKPGGILISISGVVPDDIRRSMFDDSTITSSLASSSWTWLRDGTDDLKAGCFVIRKDQQ